VPFWTIKGKQFFGGIYVNRKLSARIEIVKKSLEESIPTIIEGIETIQLYITKDNLNQAMDLFNDAIIMLQKINKAMEILMQLNLRYHNNFKNLYDKYLQTLHEMLQAMENEDYLLLGDLLNYELIPLLNELKKTVRNN